MPKSSKGYWKPPDSNPHTVGSWDEYMKNHTPSVGPLNCFGQTFADTSDGVREALDFMQHKFRPGSATAPNGNWRESGGIAGGGGNMSNQSSTSIQAGAASINRKLYVDLETRTLNGNDHPTRRRREGLQVKDFGPFGTWTWGGNQQMEADALNAFTRSSGMIQINPDGTILHLGDVFGILGFDGGGSTKSNPKNFKMDHSYGGVVIQNGIGKDLVYGLGEDIKEERFNDAIRMDVFTPGNKAQGTENTNLYQIIENDFGDSDALSTPADVETYINETVSDMSWNETTPSNQVGADIYVDNNLGTYHSSSPATRAINTIDGGSSDGIGTNGAAKMLVGEYTNPADSDDKRTVAINHEANAFVTEDGSMIINPTAGPVPGAWGYRTWADYNEAMVKAYQKTYPSDIEKSTSWLD